MSQQKELNGLTPETARQKKIEFEMEIINNLQKLMQDMMIEYEAIVSTDVPEDVRNGSREKLELAQDLYLTIVDYIP